MNGSTNSTTFFPPQDGIELVRQGAFAFYADLATVYPIITNEFDEDTICELKEIQMYKTQPMHANYQKKSPFRDMFETW